MPAALNDPPFKSHLHRDRNGCGPHKPGLLPVWTRAAESLAIVGILAVEEKYQDYRARAYQARHKRGNARPVKAEFRKSEVSVYQHIVAGNVHGICRQHYPHRHRRVLYAVAPLGKGVEQRHRHDAGQIYKVVRPYQRKQFRRLPELVDMKIKHGHYRGQRQREGNVQPNGSAQQRAYAVAASLAEKCSNQRRYAIGESNAAEEYNVEKIVDKRSRCQRGGGVVAHHNIVGKTHHNGTELPYKYGQPER